MKAWEVHRWALTLAVVSAVCLFLTGPASAAGTWVDEVWNMVTFEKATYPTSNFDPYLDRLSKIRSGVLRGDHQIVKVETDRFLKMLLERAHGINDVAADEIYNFALSVRPTDQTASVEAIELGIGTERPMSVPDHSRNTGYEGGPWCKEGGCDYWLDDVFDPGAS
jgi:hypothetical protein